MKKIIGSLAMITLLAAFTPPAPMLINNVFEFPIENSITNPCNGEEITVTGIATVKTHGVINGRNAAITGHVTGFWTGIDTKGNTYSVHANNSFPIYLSLQNGRLVSSTSSIVIYNSSGSGSFRSQLRLQTVINANGDVTSNMELERSGFCLGN